MTEYRQPELISGTERPVRFHWQLSESNERYTPEYVVNIARGTFDNGIDLDPASNPAANAWIKARRFYTVEDDGLTAAWSGSVWLNPPYGKIDGNKSSVDAWARRCVQELTRKDRTVRELCFLIGGRHQHLTNVQALLSLEESAALFLNERIKFLRIPGNMIGNLENFEALEIMNQPSDNNVLIYAGPNRERFAEFGFPFGVVLGVI